MSEDGFSSRNQGLRSLDPRRAPLTPPRTQYGATRSNAGKKKTSDGEGRKRIVRHVSYERSQKNRTRAIEIHGTTCGFDFEEFYGRVYADGHIQIHHIKVLSEHEGMVDPATDLVPLCANCHAMAHRRWTA